MKIQKRKRVFETNSSSVHALCIYKEKPAGFVLPSEVTIGPGQFGWEHDTYSSTIDKLSYVYQMCLGADEEKAYIATHENAYKPDGIDQLEGSQVDRFVQILEDLGIRVWLDAPKCGEKRCITGYIDHVDDWIGVLDDFLDDTDQLIRFLFVDKSMIQTGNDNDDSCETVGTVPPKEYDHYDIICK